MTCKDCIHYDVCYHIEHYGRELETDQPCKDFKPSVNMIEVVRCKDCKHYYHGTCTNDFALNLMRDDYFCCYGEKMGDVTE